MSPSLGRPILISGPYGLWMLGHETPFGIQMSIENFDGLSEGRDFCRRLGITPGIEIQGKIVSQRDVEILIAVSRGVHSMAMLAATLGTSIPAVRESSERMEAMGVTITSHHKKVGKREVFLTEEGSRMSASLIAGGL